MGKWVSKSNDDLEWVKLAEDESFEGVLMGDMTCNGANGEFTAYKLQAESGKLYGFSGASIANQLGDVRVGSKVRITFEGQKQSKSGRTFNAYQVDVYLEDGADLSDVTVEPAPATENTSEPVTAGPKPAYSF